MKAGIVTWSTFNNYGTLLQAYALQQTLERIGIRNQILSDCEILKSPCFADPPCHVQREEESSDSVKSKLLRLLKDPKRISRIVLARIDRKAYERPYYATQEKLNAFRRTRLNIYENVTIENAPELNDKFDCFICGSDQIWSVLSGTFRPFYFLDFAKKRKIAYAPSLGTDTIPDFFAEEIRRRLLEFDAISVRERSSALWLSDLMGKKVSWTADPTLLQDQEFWRDFAGSVSPIPRRYLLCYFIEHKKWYLDYARKLARQHHLRLLLLPNHWEHLSCAELVKESIGPEEFVSMIAHAEHILTDSYHGSVFSLIFEKNFQYLLRFADEDPDSQNIRIQSLFSYLHINSRIVRSAADNQPQWSMDYSQIRLKIKKFRDNSMKFLNENLKKG